MTNRGTDITSLDELEWALKTILRMIGVVSRHAELTDRRDAALHHLTKGVLWLESIIQEQLQNAHRRHDDTRAKARPQGPPQEETPGGSPATGSD